ncbi:MAG: hypothetical protein Q8N63_05250 [Nanoarchaeota archaeon]|nr:hypothetical protein [Nanoarchaeota archaeon]
MRDIKAPKAPIRGNCSACGTLYDEQVFSDDSSIATPYSRHVYMPCEQCGYDPKIKKNIEELIRQGTSAEVSKDGIKIDYKEISEIIDREFKKFVRTDSTKDVIDEWSLNYSFVSGIQGIFYNHAKLKFYSKGTFEFNVEELSDLVNQKIIDAWRSMRIKNDRNRS